MKINLDRKIWDENGFADKYIVAKVCYFNKNLNQKCVRVFKSELKKGDIYMELFDFDANPLFKSKRRLYKIPYFADYETQYKEYNSGSDTYLIPFDKLVLEKTVEEDFIEKNKELFEEFFSEDEHINKMTIRDFAAIIWKKPVSQKEFLNNLIKNIYGVTKD